MMGVFSNMTFLQPIILSALLALPLLWYLLRVTPPAPRRVFFPPARLLIGLIPEDHTPSKTPWWILILRLLMAALVIIALARPVINQADVLPGHDAIRLVIDNSWASAQTWDLQIAQAEETLAQAGREKREIYILTTTSIIGENKPRQNGPLGEAESTAILRGLTPLPWPSDYKAAAELLNTTAGKSIYSIWFSHGLDEGKASSFASALQKQGGLTFYKPKAEKLPLLLRPSKLWEITENNKDPQKKSEIAVAIDAPRDIPENMAITVQAQGSNSQILDIQSANLNTDKLPQTVSFDIMEAMQSDLTQFRIGQRKGAGAIFLLDDQTKKRNIGIVGNPEQSDSAPLMDDSYYIKRALEPYANITVDSITQLIEQNVAMIALPDIAAMPAETLNALEKWVKDGGLLLRFSGPIIASSQSEHFLLPVNLRSGERSLSGAMTWEKPQSISAFAETSPFYGLDIPDDLTIRQQILADPAQDLSDKIWAQLADGTPLITAAPLEKGLIVLIHTTAGPTWSDLPLSGLYVNLLRRITTLTGKNFSLTNTVNHRMLEPILVMDGFGALIAPDPTLLPLPAKDAEKTVPSSIHPPGLYGQGGLQYALNLGTALGTLNAVNPMPAGVAEKRYESVYEFDLMPYILYAALLLFFADWLIMMFIAGSLRRATFSFTKTALVLFILLPAPSYAASEKDIRYANGLYLAYIRTGDTSIDSINQSGLENLADVLKQRTSVEPEGVVALDPESDNLAFFPIVYWAVGESQNQLSSNALKNIQSYLDHGGTILFDTRDQSRGTSSASFDSPTSQTLRQITTSLNIPPLAPIEENHVLGQSFYLLKSYPGRYRNGTIWIEQESAKGRDGVSSVIIGSNDWAGAWASYTDEGGFRYNPTGKTSQPELAMRFGVNLVMYALTGNYKADQVHIPFILERLGK